MKGSGSLCLWIVVLALGSAPGLAPAQSHKTRLEIDVSGQIRVVEFEHGVPSSNSVGHDALARPVYVPIRLPDGFEARALGDGGIVLLSGIVEGEERYVWWKAGELRPVQLPAGVSGLIYGEANASGDVIVDVFETLEEGDRIRAAVLRFDGTLQILPFVGVWDNRGWFLSRHHVVGDAIAQWAVHIDGDGFEQLIPLTQSIHRWGLAGGVETLEVAPYFNLKLIPYAVNDQGHVLAERFTSEGESLGLFLNETLVDPDWGLFDLWFDTAVLNDLGHVAGSSLGLPFYWDGQWRELGDEPGWAAAINVRDEILVNQDDGRVILWRNHAGLGEEPRFVPTDLSTVVPGLVPERGLRINDEGMILLTGTLHGGPLGDYLLVPAALAVDANRDGAIHLSHEVSSDLVSATQPFRFWINDDDDENAAAGNDIPGRPAGIADYGNGVVDSVRDLVDFFPVYLELKPLLAVLPPSASVKYKLKQAEGAVNFVYSNLSRDRALSFQKEVLATGFGPQFSQPAGTAATHQVPAQGIELAPAFLESIAEEKGGVILIEGRVTTTAPLVLAVEKDGATVAEVLLPLRISQVEQMFRHIDLTRETAEYDGRRITPAVAAAGLRTADPGEAWPDALTNGKYFVFVHGYNVDGQQARGWQAEIFKRLHVLGSKARFVGVTWHGATGLDYHKAVFHAFLTGDKLAGALAFTQDADVTIAAHSLGNMVVSHAVQSGGFTPARYYLINAAVPIEAYNPEDVGGSQPMEMTELRWREYDERLFVSSWHKLFDPTDGRSRLTWKERFDTIQASGLGHNFFTNGEDVVANASDASNASVLAVLLRQGFDLTTGAWKAQELVKGVSWITSLASLFMERGQAGWDFNPGWNLTSRQHGPPAHGSGFISIRRGPNETADITAEELKTKPFFDGFRENNLTHPNAAMASAKAREKKVQYDLLARAVPASSYAAAANNMESFALRNFDMQTSGHLEGAPLPTPTGAWRHSDFMRVALNYVYPMYEEMVIRGELR